ncbi:hypothetical protein SK069_10890 [Patulibacter brassicae]|uniref:Serine/threonine protein kinase n=1 Tax=Patulibacter brassicae TaxID=1705717 RepID=A0ABU4VMC8_9ACTN|nr:hypothetical protein [Patulibacter brassicae]MDX8152101.1 hypothetical protein [Patulibacter brassicae]
MLAGTAVFVVVVAVVLTLVLVAGGEDEIPEVAAVTAPVTTTAATATATTVIRETPASSAARRTRVPSAATRCGSGLFVNSVTTCSFAFNVQAAYDDAAGSGSRTVRAYSPTTGTTYTMRCSGRPVTICRGGDRAAVYLR